MLGRSGRRLTLGATLMTMLMLLTASAAESAPLSKVRFVNALAGAGAARVEVVSATTGVRTSAGGESAFGEITPYAATSAGSVRLELVAEGTHATAPAHLRADAAYTVIAIRLRGRARLRLYQDGGAIAGKARLRVIHAAPELGNPDLALDGRPIAQGLRFGSSTGYVELTPGSDQLAVMSASHRTVASGTVSLSAGTATTAIVVGSAGQPVRVVSAQDATVTSGGAPETGLGGFTSGGGPRWLLILAAMLAGGALAGALHVAAGRRGSR